MRLIAIADDDCRIGRLDERANVLVALGDLLDKTILSAANRYKASTILAVKGNHDFNSPFRKPIVDVHGVVFDVAGVRFGGFAGCWRYKPRGHFLFDQWEVRSLMRTFPKVDVFLAHNSPRGIHERDDHVHQGFDSFRDYIDREKPRYFIHGHQHRNQRTLYQQT